MSDSPTVGGSCLEGFEKFLNHQHEPHEALDARAPSTKQYIVVHGYLVPGDVRQRSELRAEIHRNLTELGATQLHDLAFAVPTCPGGERETAESTWERLLFAGGPKSPSDGTHAWEDGDVFYVHYVAEGGAMCVIAAAPREGRTLPQLPFP